MISVPEEVERIIKKSQYLEDMLARDLVNLSSLAREIQPKIEERLYKKVSIGSIVMALKRLSKKLATKPYNVDISEHLGDIIVRSKLVEITYQNSKTLQSGLINVLEQYEDRSELFVNFSRGTFETTIICNQSILDEIKEILEDEELIAEFPKLGSLTIKLDEQVVGIKGVYYTILQVLAREGINVFEVVSTFKEITILVDEKDVDIAFSLLKKVFSN